MKTIDALVQWGHGEMTATEVVAHCPHLPELIELSPDLAKKSEKLNQTDKDAMRVFAAFLSKNKIKQ